MPKIVIREIDNTKGSGAAYKNFAVVVPGFVKEPTEQTATSDAFMPNRTVFDENGVYTCEGDKNAFEKNVGLIGPKNHKVSDAVGPKVAEGWETAKAITEEEFDIEIEKGTLYVALANATKDEGALRNKDYEYSYAEKAKKSTYSFIKEGDPEGTVYTEFAVLDNEGHNEVFQDHYGNQIAYELLNLGYTVLYKEIKSTEYLAQKSFWNPLKDKTMYDFRYIISGLMDGNADVYDFMVDVAAFNTTESADVPKFDSVGVSLDGTFTHGRGDCIALLDIDESAYLRPKDNRKPDSQEKALTNLIQYAKELPNSKYAAAFLPSVKYNPGSLYDPDNSFDGNYWFPASFHYLACAARSSERYNEWYANAGYARGISNYTIDTVGCRLGEAAVNLLQRRSAFKEGTETRLQVAINPIINLRGAYYIWGNRTTETLADQDNPVNNDLRASHFLNIRQLCCTIKKKVYMACRQLTFDPNSDILWVNFCNTIKPLLEQMKADQGIADYKISKVKSSRKAFMAAKIKIVPIEAVEDFDISVYLEDSLEGTVATTEE